MSNIDLTEAVEAATSAVTYVRDAHPRVSTDADSYDVADAAITAALPHIARQVREQVAREIEADAHSIARAAEEWRQSEHHPLNSDAAGHYDRVNAEAREAAAKHLLSLAARIARGDS